MTLSPAVKKRTVKSAAGVGGGGITAALVVYLGTRFGLHLTLEDGAVITTLGGLVVHNGLRGLMVGLWRGFSPSRS